MLFVEPIITLFVAAYISIVVLGHVLLVAATLKILHDDFRGGRRKPADAPAAGDAGIRPALGC